ncbi:uncharacterized protein LOC123311403 [Coccinella septempunctata]|uniref:uncharacterized protein LOC123311403 n=1 Tax=Coccinella septempunctata TaxID=41139 RepID=UPI001D077E72|nr:uncharacterized protein LOC123311403 [Coccinella septempunctata]
MSLSTNNRQWVTELIELFKSEPCLWKVNSEEFKDCEKRDRAYEKIVNKVREVESGADKETAWAKIESLRSEYREELKKVIETKSEFTGIEKYVPDLWFFPLMRFLDKEELKQLDCMDESSEGDEEPQASCSGATNSSSQEGDHLDLDDEGDYHDFFGEMVAIKLRAMSEEQRQVAIEMIDHILLEAQSGRLTENHVVVPGAEGDAVRVGDLPHSHITSILFHALSLQDPRQDDGDAEMKEERT